MKKLPLMLLAMGVLALSSCKKEPEKVYPENPIVSISVTCSGETVEGVVDDAARKVRFTFNQAETFSSCDIQIELAEGWTLDYPKTLLGVDLQSTPTLNFSDHIGAIVKYGVTFSSNAFPIVDASKIQIEGLKPGENISLDNAAKIISISYDEAKIDMTNVKIIFNDGALQEGCTAQENLTYDFTDGLEQPLVLNLGGERPYTLKLDVSAYLGAAPEALQFMNVSSSFGNLDGIEVYTTESINPMPACRYTTSADDFWLPSNPRDWEFHDASWVPTYPSAADCYAAEDVYTFPGDWEEGRPTQHCYGKVAIVYIDQAKYKGDIAANIDMSKNSSAFSSPVVVTGCKKGGQINYMVYDELAMANEGDTELPWRSAFGFDNKGKASFAYAATHGSELYKVPAQNTWCADAAGVAAAADEKWDVKDAAWMYGQAIRDGKALKGVEIAYNDGSQFYSDSGVMGMGWQGFYHRRVIIGETYDNKIAILASDSGADLWDGSCNPEISNFPDGIGWGIKGYTTPQLMWIAKTLGWKNASLVASSDDEKDSSITPSVLVGGQPVVNAADANLAASYFITFDKR